MGCTNQETPTCPNCGTQIVPAVRPGESSTPQSAKVLDQILAKLVRLDMLINRRQSPWRTVSEVAKQLGVTERTVRRYYDWGKLKSHKTLSGSIRINQNDIDAWIMFKRPFRKLTRPQKEQLKELCR